MGFKISVTNMFNKTDKNENFNRELEPKNQMKILELKNITEIKNWIDSFNSISDIGTSLEVQW